MTAMAISCVTMARASRQRPTPRRVWLQELGACRWGKLQTLILHPNQYQFLPLRRLRWPTPAKTPSVSTGNPSQSVLTRSPLCSKKTQTQTLAQSRSMPTVDSKRSVGFAQPILRRRIIAAARIAPPTAASSLSKPPTPARSHSIPRVDSKQSVGCAHPILPRRATANCMVLGSDLRGPSDCLEPCMGLYSHPVRRAAHSHSRGRRGFAFAQVSVLSQ